MQWNSGSIKRKKNKLDSYAHVHYLLFQLHRFVGMVEVAKFASVWLVHPSTDCAVCDGMSFM